MELKGKVHFIGEQIIVSDKFKKRELVVEFADNPQYPEYIKIEAVQDKCSLLDAIKLGNEVEVSFNLKGREWINKEGVKQYFNSLHLWKVNILDSGSVPEPVKQVDISTPQQENADDLPF
jgi:hypothetical protein